MSRVNLTGYGGPSTFTHHTPAEYERKCTRTGAPREDDDAVARLPEQALPLLEVVPLGDHQLVHVRELHLVDHPPAYGGVHVGGLVRLG